MKTIINYKIIILQAILLFIGTLLISSLAAQEPTANSKFLSTINTIDCEMEIDMENWMYELDNWSVNSSANTTLVKELELASDMEEQINIEEWMLSTNSKYWSSYTSSDFLKDDEITLEEWMLNAEILLTSI